MRGRQESIIMAFVLVCLILLGNVHPLIAAPPVPAAAIAANPLFNDDFEMATLGSSWSSSITSNGAAELNTIYPHSGVRGIFLGQKVSGSASASLVLALNLSGQTDVYLDFWARRTGNNAYRSVSISDNGGATWTDIYDFNLTSLAFTHEVLNIANIAAGKGLVLNSQFRILFYYGSYTNAASDGLIIDDVRIAHSSEVVAAFPYAQNTFETGDFQQGLYTQGSGNGIAEIGTTYAHSGGKSVFLGQKADGDASATLRLALDLSSQTDVVLDFWARRTGNNAYRSVSISDNSGRSWTKVYDFNLTALSFTHQVLNIASLASAKGLALTKEFQISIYYGSYTRSANDGLVIDDLRVTQRTGGSTAFPLPQETFEGGDFSQGLYPQGSGNGVAEINQTYPHSGSSSVFLGQKTDGDAEAWLALALDLTGQTDVLLDFWARRTGNNAYRSVWLSDNDGVTWKKVSEFNLIPLSFTHQVLNIASLAATNGLALNNQFRIYVYYGSYTRQAGDGLVIDDLKVVRTSVSGKVYNEAATVGNEVSGAFVEICSASNSCQTIASNTDGSYGFGDLAAGSYTLRALPPAGNTHLIGKLGPITLAANTPLTNQNLLLPKANGLPSGTGVTPSIGSSDGVPGVFWRTTTTLTQRACANGSAAYQIYADGTLVRSGSLAEAPAGTYTTQLAPFYPLHGTIQVQVNVQCATGPQVINIFNIWIDPSGLVVDTQGAPINNATVSLYSADAPSGPFTLVASGSGIMSPANRVNPMKSDQSGAFGWDVIAGYYRVRAEKAGCTAVNSSQPYAETAVLTIPPPVTDLRLVLFCGEARKIWVPMTRR